MKLEVGKWYVDVDGPYKILRKIIGEYETSYEVFEFTYLARQQYYESTLLEQNPTPGTSLLLKLHNVKQD